MTSPPTVEPRHATPLIPGRPNLAGRVSRVSRAILGRPFMPWQLRASQLLNEIDPATGLRAHPVVVVTVQRQAGKTSWLGAEAVERCLLGQQGRRVWYTAQSGKYAREKWAEVAQLLTAAGSPLAGYVAAKWSNGSERVTFPNGSTFGPFPPTRDALHGEQSDLVIVDEAWRHDARRGGELLQAIGPTQATRPGAQVVIVSTMGTIESEFLHALVDQGRGGADGIAYLEYGIGDHGDPTDLDAVAAAHPAIGHTIDRDFLAREARVMAPGEFARAYGNARTTSDERYISPELWSAAATDELPDRSGRLVLAAELAQDRSRAAIIASAAGVLEVVESRPGIEWVGPRLLDLAARWSPAAIVVDPAGPSSTLHDELTRAGLTLYPLQAAERLTAPQRLMDDLAAGAVRVVPHPDMDAAADAAKPRVVGDGWVWGRRLSGGPIPEIVAGTLAAWVDLHKPAPPARPRIRVAAG